MLHPKKVGETIDVTAPAGVFYANPKSVNPLVLISGGLGVTPLITMVEANSHSLQKAKQFGSIAVVMKMYTPLKTQSRI